MAAPRSKSACCRPATLFHRPTCRSPRPGSIAMDGCRRARPQTRRLEAMQLTGIHHLTAVTADAPGNHRFYTEALGLRLVKKTVNQDDVSAYHLFYADGLASPGTDITFFDWPVGRERRGTNSIVRTGLRVGQSASLEWWETRFESLGVASGKIRERD